MTSHTHNLESLIGSRICHDLISPIGAIHNGIELLMLGQTKDVPDEEMSLIFDSCRHAENKVKFFRLAFGQNYRGSANLAHKSRGDFTGLP